MSATPTAAADRELLMFGDFELDRAAGCLRRAGHVIALRPKAWHILVHLAERPGMLVGTEELHRAVWGTVAVTPNAMTNVIGELRRALDDDANPPRVIETVRRRGYRFIAPTATAVAVAGGTKPTRADAQGFIGRTTELTLLRDAGTHAAHGTRQGVFISGEPGLGKSTLVERATHDLPAGTLIHVQCIEGHGSNDAYMPILHVIEQLVRGPRHEEVVAVLRRFAPTWLSQLPWLLTTDDSTTLTRTLAGVGAARMLREGAVMLEELARATPLTVVLEDLHWSDAPTIDLLATLLQRSGPARLLVIGTYRPIDALVHGHPVATLVTKLRRQPGVRIVPLPPFTVVEVAKCLAQDLDDAAVADQLALPIGRHTGGNPLFIKAVSTQLRHEGWLQRAGAGWQLTIDLERFSPPLPDDLRELIELQIATLPADCLRVLEAASVIATDISVDAIAAVLEWEPARVADVCHGLAQRSIHLRALPAPACDERLDAQYAFTHALYQRGFQDRIAPSERRRLHAAIATRLEHTHAARLDDVAARLAGHFEAAADLDRAAHHRALAGAVAIRRLAYIEGVRELQTALAHLARVSASPDTTLRCARIHLNLGNALLSARGFVPDVGEAFERAAALARTVGAVREQVRALIGLSSYTLGCGTPRDAQPFVEQLLALQDGPDALPQYSLVRAGHVQLILGRPVQALALLDQSARATPEPGVPVLIDARAEAESFRALALAQLGRPAEAHEAAIRALQHAERAGLSWGTTITLYTVIEAYLLQRDLAHAAPLTTQLIAHLHVHESPTRLPIARFQQLYLSAASGERVALDDLRHHLAVHHRSGDRWHHTVHLACLAEIELQQGAIDAAERSLDVAFAHLAAGGEERIVAELWRLRGDAARQRGDRNAARHCYQSAFDLAAAQGSRLFEDRATAALADLDSDHQPDPIVPAIA